MGYVLNALRRNPLKSGQCFLQIMKKTLIFCYESRNPLKSGQCFLPGVLLIYYITTI